MGKDINNEREIKFRAKAINDDFFKGEWVYGYYTKELWSGNLLDVITDGANDIPIQVETLGQFTGLCDKNGKEIYEGDIINFTFYSDMAGHAHLGNGPEMIRPQIVEFYDCRFVLHDFTLDKENVRYFNFTFSDKFKHRYEIAGNIYDSPDLLKGNKL